MLETFAKTVFLKWYTCPIIVAVCAPSMHGGERWQGRYFLISQMLETLAWRVLLTWLVCPILVAVCAPVKYTLENDAETVLLSSRMLETLAGTALLFKNALETPTTTVAKP